MPTVCASVPMQAPEDDELAAQPVLDRAVDLRRRQQRVGPLLDVRRRRGRPGAARCRRRRRTCSRRRCAWLCTTIAGSMPILLASCSAAPSAFGPGGHGQRERRLHHPVAGGVAVRPDDRSRQARADLLLLRAAPGPGCRRRRPSSTTPSRPLPPSGRPLGDAERAVGDRLDQALGVVGDPAEQVDRLARARCRRGGR